MPRLFKMSIDSHKHQSDLFYESHAQKHRPDSPPVKLDQEIFSLKAYKMKNILTCENNTETLPIKTPYTYDKYIRFEVPNIPQYNKPLISSSIVSDNFDLNNFDLNTI